MGYLCGPSERCWRAMQVPGFKVPTGNVYRVEGKRRAVWYARYRLAAGREVGKRIGPAWTWAGETSGRVLHEAHSGSVAERRPRPGPARNAARRGANGRDVRRTPASKASSRPPPPPRSA